MLHLKYKKDNKKIEDRAISFEYVSDIVKLAEYLNSSNSSGEKLSRYDYEGVMIDRYIFSDGSVKEELIAEGIYDSHINEYILESSEFEGCFINSKDLKINIKSDYLFLYDDNMSIMIPVIKYSENNTEYYRIYISKYIPVKKFLLSRCDGCSCIYLKDLLFNLYPEINVGLDKKYMDFKGSVCSECLSKMEKGLSLKNYEEKDAAESGASNVGEKIDEFSSIEEILKFCGMENREELEKIVRSRIE